LNFVTGDQLVAFDPLPANIQTAGALVGSDNPFFGRPYFELYTGEPLAADFNVQLPTVPQNSAFSTSTIADYCDSSFATSSGFLDAIGSSISNGFCRIGSFLFVPAPNSITAYSQLSSTTQSKIPFSYYFDVKGIYDSSVASSTQNMQSYSISLGAFDSSSSTAMGPILPQSLNFFSTTTINKYLPAGMHDTIYLIMQYAIWMEVMYLIYRRIVPKHAKI
jgi:hypothetical protein